MLKNIKNTIGSWSKYFSTVSTIFEQNPKEVNATFYQTHSDGLLRRIVNNKQRMIDTLWQHFKNGEMGI